MSTSKHAFEQVKSILGKLDRSIDAARARRLSGARHAAPTQPNPGAAQPQPAAPAEPQQARPLRATPAFSGGTLFPRQDRA